MGGAGVSGRERGVISRGKGRGLGAPPNHGAGGQRAGGITTLPEVVLPTLREHLAEVQALSEAERAEGVAGVYLPEGLERKFPQAGKSRVGISSDRRSKARSATRGLASCGSCWQASGSSIHRGTAI